MTHPLADSPPFEVLAAIMRQHPPAECPVRNFFLPGIYCREITMPAGTLILSMQHKTRHPFVVSAGVVEVVSTTGPGELISAPHFGITEPGTRRMLRVLADTVWTTFHATDKTTVEEIAAEILEPTEAPDLEQWKLTLPA